MIKQTSLDFLSNLKLNNSKEWFEQNRDLYETYKSDILQLFISTIFVLKKICGQYSSLN